MHNLSVNVHHVTRVEGHGNIVVDVKGGTLKDVRLDIVESPRFFEAMLRGRNYLEAPHITCRICGICSVGHTCSSLKAAEAAGGVPVSRQTVALRKIILDAEILQSHVLHVYLLAAPDFLGAGSVFDLVPDHKEVVLRAMRLKGFANDLCAVVGGRHIHPLSMCVGGFTKIPEAAELEHMAEHAVELWPDVEATVELFGTLKVPAYEREMEFVSLKDPEEYAFYGGDLFSSVGGPMPVDDYRRRVNEYVVPHSTAKHTRSESGNPYMVGALARVNNNFDQLVPEAKEAAAAMGLAVPCHNPYMNNIAQVVEIVHILKRLPERIEGLLREGLREEVPDQRPRRAGRGVGATEVPRGVLFHEYEIEKSGRIKAANCIIPTGQNLANIEADMRAFVPRMLGEHDQDEITLLLEMLVRAYDPCISCSTHLLEVEFV